jgi:hypothetical protein
MSLNVPETGVAVAEPTNFSPLLERAASGTQPQLATRAIVSAASEVRINLYIFLFLFVLID